MATLQYSRLENPTDGGAWWAAVYGVARSWTRLKRLSSSSSSSSSSNSSMEYKKAKENPGEAKKLIKCKQMFINY